MSLFSLVYAERNAEVRAILDGVDCPTPKRVEEILAQSETCDGLELSDLAELLQAGATESAYEQFEMLRAYTSARWRIAAGNSVRYVAPIYVSSYCVDACPYCNFSALRKDTVSPLVETFIGAAHNSAAAMLVEHPTLLMPRKL